MQVSITVFQKTIGNPIKARGVGLHCGKSINMLLRPAPENTGIVFRRIDLPGKPEIPAQAHNVRSTVLCTTLGEGQGQVSTVEHLMSAFHGMDVDNCYVDIDGPEIPIMDGSSWHFVFLIRSAGVVEQSEPRKYIKVIKEVSVTEDGKQALFRPYDGFKVNFEIQFDHPAFSGQPGIASVDLSKECFVTEISRARTFGFMEDIEKLRSMNLALGGSLDNAIVVDHEGIANEDGLRFMDEFVKHKILDAVGDLYLAGHPIHGEFFGLKSGHALNNQLLLTLLADEDAWELCTLEETFNNVSITAG